MNAKSILFASDPASSRTSALKFVDSWISSNVAINFPGFLHNGFTALLRLDQRVGHSCFGVFALVGSKCFNKSHQFVALHKNTRIFWTMKKYWVATADSYWQQDLMNGCRIDWKMLLDILFWTPTFFPAIDAPLSKPWPRISSTFRFNDFNSDGAPSATVNTSPKYAWNQKFGIHIYAVIASLSIYHFKCLNT